MWDQAPFSSDPFQNPGLMFRPHFATYILTHSQ